VKSKHQTANWGGSLGPSQLRKPRSLALCKREGLEDAFVARAPIAVDDRVIARGQERFNIYCSPCHDKAGTGQGTVVQRGFPGPIDLASDNTRHMTDGELFTIITNGIRNMAALGEQVPISDRWPIVTWVRVLQRSQHATMADVEPSQKTNILPPEVNP
jgi:mono/diheme cytochrome c family protein